MFRFTRILALVFVVVTLGLFLGNRYVSKASFARVSYPDLKRHLAQTEKAFSEINQYQPKPEEFVSHRVTKNIFEKDLRAIKKQIKLRQLNLGLALASIFFIVLTILAYLIRVIRYGSAVGLPVKGFYHNGSIDEKPSRVDTIEREELTQKMVGGYAERKQAEMWLRTDDFLRCPTCEKPAKIDLIGAVQEILFYEDTPRGIPQDQVRQLGHKWISIPIDEYQCSKCGHASQRRHR